MAEESAPREKIHPASYTLGQRGPHRYHAWVFFTYKPASLSKAVSPMVVPRAVRRRARRGVLSPAAAERLDRPVAPRFIEEVRASGATIRRVSRWLNAVSVSASTGELAAIAGYDFVARIEPVRRWRRAPLPDSPGLPPVFSVAPGQDIDYGPSAGQLAMLNVPALHKRGYTGRSVRVLMLDTGFYQGHEAISHSRILEQYDFLEDDGQTGNETNAEVKVGQHNHGTYTYTALGGYAPGHLVGPAFECSYLLAKTESVPGEFQGEEDNYVAALEWGDSLGADVVSSSLGYLDWYTYADLDGLTAVTTLGVRWATRLGMVVVTAAGNERGSAAWGGYIIAPADADSIIAVGAVTPSRALASFSSHGPTADGRFKPELMAQGTFVACASPSAPDRYTLKAGTSLSTPLVAGSVALLLQAHPEWGPGEVRAALLATASRADSPDNDFGWGIPDLLAALEYPPDDTLTGPTVFALKSVYPNPFLRAVHSYATIHWTLPSPGSVSIRIHNLLGQQVASVYHQPQQPTGSGIAVWDGFDYRGRQVPSGVYFVRLETNAIVATRRLVVRR